MKVTHFLHLMLVFFLLSFQFEDVEGVDYIKWDASRPLTWKDFSGKIDAKSSFDAWTYSGMSYTYSWYYQGENVKVDCEIYSYFEPGQSWVKKGKMSDELLAHEQIHFDIAELHARYFEEKIELFSFTKNAGAEVDSIYEVTFNEMLAMQIKYDEESEHYRNAEGQIKWNDFVHDELKRLE